ncbi:Sugar fermentation stimulation protein A [subsurface metagenome]
MHYKTPLIQGTLIKRYKRFLADVELADGTVVTAHCANTGSMMQVSEPGSAVMISEAANPDRKTRFDWRLTEVDGKWAGIDTAVPNILLREGFETGVISQFADYDAIRMEVKYGVNSRADAMLSGERGIMYVEAKNVTLVEDGCALFPDAVTARGAKHLDELVSMVEQGHRAAMFFLTQRMDAECIGVAEKIDPYYAERLSVAAEKGVEIIAWRADVRPEGITLDIVIPFKSNL